MTEEDRVVLSIAPAPRAAEQQQPHGVIVKDRSGTAALDEAYEHGRSALTRLGEQGEALHRAEVVADSNQYVIDKSRRVVANMTWSGWLRNKFTALPKRGAAAPAPRSKGEAALAEQDAYVNALSEGLEDLRGVGEALGDELADHDERVPRLQDKMDRLWSTTRQVTRAAGRLTHASAGSTPKLLGHVALREVATRRYLRARGQDVGLSEEVDVLRATCRFALYEKRAHLLGLRSPVSGKYLAITFSGAIECASSRFGGWAEWDLDLSPRGVKGSPLVCLGANWGGGSFCRVHPKDGRLLVGEPVDDHAAANRSAKFEVLFLDDAYKNPDFADQVLLPCKGGGAARPPGSREGFLCPECAFQAHSPDELQDHYARHHA